MNNTLFMICLAATGAALLAGARVGIKSYRKRGKLDGNVIADALEAGIDTVDKRKKKS
jgi:hypothetical protein